MSTTTTLSRHEASYFIGMVVAKCRPHGWTPDQLLLRCVERNGASSVFHITGVALQVFEAWEVGRIYELMVPPTCVRLASWSIKNGIPAVFEVFISYPYQFKVSSSKWPMLHAYDFCAWESLKQKEPESYVDIIGIAEKPPVVVQAASTSMRQAHLELRNGDLLQTIVLLGDHVSLQVQKGDVVAFAGLVVHKYHQSRTLQTGYLTIAERNPTRRDCVPEVTSSSEERPRKALRLTVMMHVAVAELPTMSKEMQATGASKRSFQLVGTFEQFDSSFFSKDPPVIEGDRHVLKMRWQVRFTDHSSSYIVSVGDQACHDIFNINAPDFRELWRRGGKGDAEQASILSRLNRTLQGQYRCACTARLWKDALQVNVDLAASLAGGRGV